MIGIPKPANREIGDPRKQRSYLILFSLPSFTYATDDAM